MISSLSDAWITDPSCMEESMLWYLISLLCTQKKQVFKNKHKNASYVSILFLKPTFLCFSNPRCSVFDSFQCFIQTPKTPDLYNFLDNCSVLTIINTKHFLSVFVQTLFFSVFFKHFSLKHLWSVCVLYQTLVQC